MYDIITIGSSTIDCFVDTGKGLFQSPEMHNGNCFVHVPFGSKIIADKLTFMTGGGGSNTAVSFSRLGLKTAYIGKVGGEQGKIILNELRKEKVDLSLIVPAEDAGFSVILDAKGQDRTVITYKASNNLLKYNEIKKSKLKTKWFYMASMVGESYKSMLKLVDYACKNNIRIAFNPSSYIAKQGHKKLKKFLSCADVLVLNKEEAGELLGKDYPIKTTLKKLKLFVKDIIVVTDGENGCHCLADKYYHIGTSGKKPKETTGAGDAFASGFVAGLIKGKDIVYALKMGQANSESVIMKMGAKNDLLTNSQMNNAVKKANRRVTSKNI